MKVGSSQIMGGIKPPLPPLGGDLQFHFVVEPHRLNFYTPPQQPIKKLASEVAATAKSKAYTSEVGVLCVCYE